MKIQYKWKVAITTAVLFLIFGAALLFVAIMNFGFVGFGFFAYCYYFSFGLSSLLVKWFGDQAVFLLLFLQPPLFLFLLGFLEGRYLLSKIKKPLFVFFLQIVAFVCTIIIIFITATLDPYGKVFKPASRYTMPSLYLSMVVRKPKMSEPEYLNFEIRKFGRHVYSPSFVEGNTRHKIATIRIHETGRLCVYEQGKRLNTKTLGEFRIVFSDIMLYREDPPFEMEWGKDILECSYKEEALYRKGREGMIFSSDSPERIRFTVKKLSLVKNPARLKYKSNATTENTLYKFEGTFDITFHSLSEPTEQKQIRELQGSFILKWNELERGSE